MKSARVSQRAVAVLIAVLCVTLIGARGATSAPSAPAVQDVNVKNTASNPVPVVGTVNSAQSGPWSVSLNGTPTVSSAQVGSWNVGITGRPSVQLAPSEPVGQQLFGALSGSSATTYRQLYEVPAGKLLVLEYVSAQIGVPSGGRAFVEFFGATSKIYLPMSLQGSTGSTDVIVGSQPVRMYLPAGNTLWCSAYRTGIGGGSYACDFAGYLVDM